nr:ABC transporter G family member 35-like [Tanacetum cinerariifolium]
MSRNRSGASWRMEDVFTQGGGSYNRRSSRHSEEDEEALRWAALEKLPTYDRLRTTIMKSYINEDDENQRGHKMDVLHKEIDVRKLDPNDKQQFIDRIFKVAEEDNEKFLMKFRNRIDKVGITLPTVEVRYEHLTIEADCYIGDRALPSLANAARNLGESILGLVGISLAEKTKLTILKDASGIIKPSRYTIYLPANWL